MVYIPSVNPPTGPAFCRWLCLAQHQAEPPADPTDASPSPDEFIAGWEAAPPVHRLERPEIQSQVFDAVRAAMIKIYAGRHLRPTARVGRSRHGPAFAAEKKIRERTSIKTERQLQLPTSHGPAGPVSYSEIRLQLPACHILPAIAFSKGAFILCILTIDFNQNVVLIIESHTPFRSTCFNYDITWQRQPKVQDKKKSKLVY